MDSSNAATALLGVPDVNDVQIESLGFRGWFASSPSGQWRIAIESEPARQQPVRWALLQGDTLRASGSAETEQVFAAAVSDDATFVLARQTARLETTIEVRESNGSVLYSTRIEALGNSCAISGSGRWVAAAFEESKRADDPVVLIDADKRRLMWRKISDGRAVVSVDEARRVVVAEGREFEFGEAPSEEERLNPNRFFNADSSSGWAPTPMEERPSFYASTSPWIKVGVVLIALFVGWIMFNFIAGWLFVASAPKMLEKLEKEAAQDLVAQYDAVKKHGSRADVCRKAGEVAEFYLRVNEERAYARWKQKEKKDCEAAAAK